MSFLGDSMDIIMNTAKAAFSGQHAIEAIIIAVLLALIMGSLAQDLLFALFAVLIQLFLPVVFDVVHTGNASNVGKMAGDIVHNVPTMVWPTLVVMYLVYLILIGLLYLIKNVLFRR